MSHACFWNVIYVSPFLEVSKVPALKLGSAKNEEACSPVLDRVMQLLPIFPYGTRHFERGYLSRVRLYLALTNIVMRGNQVYSPHIRHGFTMN